MDHFSWLEGHVAPRIAEDLFERILGIPRDIYEYLSEGFLHADNYFKQKRNATGKLSAITDQKLVSALRLLWNVVCVDAICAYTKVSQRSSAEALHRCFAAVRYRFEEEWLQRPTPSVLYSIERHYSTLGFPCFVRCVDVASWTWDRCPVGYQGINSGKDKNPCNLFEVVGEDFLRISNWNFRSSLPNKDVSI